MLTNFVNSRVARQVSDAIARNPSMKDIAVGNPGFTPCAANAGVTIIPQNIEPTANALKPNIHAVIIAVSSFLVVMPRMAAVVMTSRALIAPGSMKDTHIGAVLKNPVGSENMFTNSTYMRLCFLF